MKVGIIGAGHVGLPTAAVLAHFGHDVTVTDSDEAKVEQIRSGTMPFHEQDMAELVAEGVAVGRLHFTTEISEAVAGAEVVFLCVGTPPRVTGEANLVAVEKALAEVARHADGRLVVVEKSTVPAGTSERAQTVLSRNNPGVEFLLVSNPEFLREGSAIHDTLHPDRILIGSDSPEAIAVMRELYAPMFREGTRWVETDLKTAELAKHASNAFLALKVSYANALARICESVGADVVGVADVMGADHRIGRGHLDAGLGYGGSCFPKDLAAFRHLVKAHGYDFPLLDEIERVNDEAMQAVFSKIEKLMWNLEDKRIVLLGLAFKPGTDDIRFAPALALARRLHEAGAHVVGYDPAAEDNVAREFPDIELVESLYEALRGADCAVVCTEWPEFRTIDLDKAKEVMAVPAIVDARNIFEPQVMADAGFDYIPTGRPIPKG